MSALFSLKLFLLIALLTFFFLLQEANIAPLNLPLDFVCFYEIFRRTLFIFRGILKCAIVYLFCGLLLALNLFGIFGLLIELGVASFETLVKVLLSHLFSLFETHFLHFPAQFLLYLAL